MYANLYLSMACFTMPICLDLRETQRSIFSMLKELFVGSLPWSIDDNALEDLFCDY
jgi:hypothetical protein